MDILYFTHALNGLLMIAMPIGLGIYLTRKFRLGWRLWWIGAATFVLSQVCHIPFNSGLTLLFQREFLPSPPAQWRILFNALVAGLSAGLWEESARYAMYRWWARDARSWRKGLLVGAGHGGIEAILFGGLALWGYIQLVALRGADLSAVVPAGQLAQTRQILESYWSAPWYASLLGAVERAFTIPVQIALAVLVLQVFTRKQTRWLWLAIGWHTLVDAAAVYGASAWGVYLTETAVGVASLISIGFIFVLRQPEPEPPEEEKIPAPVLEALPNLPPPEETPENLEKTRYN